MKTIEWLPATKTRNYLIGDPLLDWLELCGEKNGFTRDDQRADFDSRTDFGSFVAEKGRSFEARLCEILAERIPGFVRLERRPSESIEEQSKRTLEQMNAGAPVIAQGCVSHVPSKTYGYPDLLVRSDVLAELFPEQLVNQLPGEDAESEKQTSKLESGAIYLVVDIKFTTLTLLAKGNLSASSGSSAAYAGQLYIYNRAIGEMQGFEPSRAFLIGRGFHQASGEDKGRGKSAFDRLGPVDMHLVPKKGPCLMETTNDAVAWARRVARDGNAWTIDSPSVPELRPNMGNQGDAPWHGAKKEIANATGELTNLWQVGRSKRDAALDAGISSLAAVTCAADVGVTSKTYGPMLDAILYVNDAANPDPVLPATVTAAVETWAQPGPVEFYVDFETVSDLDDDFSELPKKNGQPLIYMIGCGHIEDGKWQFAEFTVDALTGASEVAIIDSWHRHMAAVTKRLGNGTPPLVFHWSNAERSTLESAYNSAANRNPGCAWDALNWFDFLKDVVKKDPIVVKGAMGFGLKAIAKAMKAHGLIETSWGDGPTDGLGAMVAAWTAEATRIADGVPLHEVELIREVAAYNEVDCKVMWEIVSYLRAHHLPLAARMAA